ncbi:MAG: aminopeptidase [Candidatus Paceibacterota bacterium]
MDKNEQNEPNLMFEKKFAFDIWDEATTKKAFDFCEGYKDFLSAAKTERLAVKLAEAEAVKNGFKRLEHVGESKEKGFNGPVYSINRGKAIILAKPGKKPVSDGVRMILSHIDVSRLDLKMRPLYEGEHIAYFKTQYYGAPKKYQWTSLPLAMYGVITKQDGENMEIAIGDDERDPILMITDLPLHLDKFQAKEKIDDAIPAETLNIVVGSIGASGKEGEKDLVKKNILKILNSKYGIIEEDFVSADLELVPQGLARDLGFDRSLVSAYGQDDRACSYSALEAFIRAEQSDYASILVLTDKEEIGSHGPTSVQSNFIIDFVSELLYLQTGIHDENVLRDTFFKSKAVSADTTLAFDPDYVEVFDTNNSAKIGAGVAMEKYTGGHGKYYASEATSEFTADIRKMLNTQKIVWQIGGGGKVDIGGGGTMAMYLARLNMDIIDLSIPVLSVHAPFEIASKADIYSAYLAYKAFFEAKQ